jgi:cytoskeletal protein CcmA (bactofilin family)
MSAQNQGEARISGSGTVGGGVYERVLISGSGRITGDVEAESISISGSGTVAGSVKAGIFRTSGSSVVEGNLEVKEFRCSGSGKVAGDLDAESFRVSGSVEVRGRAKAGEARISGSGEFGQGVEADSFHSSGSVTVEGRLGGDTIELSLGGHSRTKEIGGKQITVVRGAWSGLFGWLSKLAGLEATTVEGDEVHLEDTRAELVRGRRVTVGPGCHIQRVEYSESLSVDPAAEVAGHQYTGQAASAPAVERRAVERPEGWARDQRGEEWGWVTAGVSQLRSPLLRGLGAALGLLVAACVLAIVVFVVLPAVGFVLHVVLVAVAVLLVALAVLIPVVVLLRYLAGRH